MVGKVVNVGHRLVSCGASWLRPRPGSGSPTRPRDARTGTRSAPTKSWSAIKPASVTAADTRPGHAAHATRRFTGHPSTPTAPRLKGLRPYASQPAPRPLVGAPYFDVLDGRIGSHGDVVASHGLESPGKRAWVRPSITGMWIMPRAFSCTATTQPVFKPSRRSSARHKRPT
jgi:hypothetical protein